MKAILTILALGGLFCCTSAHAQCCAPPSTKGLAADACCPVLPTKESKVTLKITGMTCDKCAAAVQKALKKLDGVKAAEVSLEKKQAIVTVNSAKVNTKQLIAAIEKAGGDRHTFKAERASVFQCSQCGKTSDQPGRCCGAPRKNVEKSS